MNILKFFQKNRSWGLGLLFLLGLSPDAVTQTRKFTSQFSHFQGYFNPGLAGYEVPPYVGLSVISGLGWKGRPRLFSSALKWILGK